MIRRLFAVPDLPLPASLALFVLRVVAGSAFMIHGSGKIGHAFTWMGPDAGTPGIFQALAAVSEFGGGLAWILGLLTPLATLGILSTMTVALWTHLVKRGDPFVSATGGPAAELAAVFFAVALVLLAAGPGRVALDRVIFGIRGRAGYARFAR